MSTLTNALTTNTKVKSYLGITDSASDTLIDMLIDQATGFIENYCGGRRFLSQAYTSAVDVNGGDKIFFEQYPVTTLTSVKYRSGTPSTPVWNTYSADSYMLYGSAGYLRFFGELPTVAQGLQLVYTAGYLIDFANETDTTKHNLPNDLTMACTMLVAHYHTIRQASGISSLATEGQSVSFKGTSDQLPDAVKQVLGAYQAFRYGV